MCNLRLELFTWDTRRLNRFYTQALGFENRCGKDTGYIPLVRGSVQLSVQEADSLPRDHPAYPDTQQKIGLGIEIVLEVDDLEKVFAAAKDYDAEGLTIIKMQPWGLRDFRLHDPDGRYIRITAKDEKCDARSVGTFGQ